MLIPTNLIADSGIVQGLASGELVRYGSVIRHAAGTVQGGQIVRHLAEAPGLTSQLAGLPFAPITGAANLAVNGVGHAVTFNKLVGIDHQLTGLQQTASSILGVSQIAAGASVLGLGVSVAGFAYMGSKLNQVQKSVANLQKSMDAGFQRVEDRLDKISGQLNYLYLLVEDSREQQKRLSQAITELHKAFLIQKIAKLQAELESLKRFPDDSPKDAINTATEVRLFLGNQALQTPCELEPNTLMLVDVATQGWVAATATEAQLLLRHGYITDAREVLAETVPQLQENAQHWGEKLLESDRDQLNTAYRFATPDFHHHISKERVQRIARISPRDRDLSPEKAWQKQQDAEVEMQMSRTKPRLDKHWQYQQLALAEYLDTLSELAARLDSLLAFAKLCERQGVKSSQELLPGNDWESGLYLLPAE
jgi:hypothetical protein